MQLAGDSAALIFLRPHEAGSQGTYLVTTSGQVRCEPIFDFPGVLNLSDVWRGRKKEFRL